MKELNIDCFVYPQSSDFEVNQYLILDALKKYQTEFNHKRLYPEITDLIKLSNQLQDLLDDKIDLEMSFPRTISNFDLQNQKVNYEQLEKIQTDSDMIFRLIDWGLPVIKNLIEEGIIVHEFVEENIKIEEVGVVPLYKNEGYFMIVDNKKSELEIHRFECSLFTSGNEPYRALKTKYLESIKNIIIKEAPESIKLNLIKKYHDLPNPATYICDSSIDFPFDETIFPIAKRKLISKVASA